MPIDDSRTNPPPFAPRPTEVDDSSPTAPEELAQAIRAYGAACARSVARDEHGAGDNIDGENEREEREALGALCRVVDHLRAKHAAQLAAADEARDRALYLAERAERRAERLEHGARDDDASARARDDLAIARVEHADAVERLEKRVAEAERARNEMASELRQANRDVREALDRATAAEGEVERLRAEVEEWKGLARKERTRAEAAEHYRDAALAEVAELREASQAIEDRRREHLADLERERDDLRRRLDELSAYAREMHATLRAAAPFIDARAPALIERIVAAADAAPLWLAVEVRSAAEQREGER